MDIKFNLHVPDSMVSEICLKICELYVGISATYPPTPLSELIDLAAQETK
jgi:hypothetical protein